METARTPASVAWPEKLITQAEAFAKAAHWRFHVGLGELPEGSKTLLPPNVNLYCDKCERSMGQLLRDCIPYNGTLDEMLSMVLRHMVMAHDEPLNTRERPADGNPGA